MKSKFTIALTSLAAFGCSILVGCSTGVEDIQEARAELQEAQSEANEIVAAAKEKADEDLAETRKMVLDEIDANQDEVKQAKRSDAEPEKVEHEIKSLNEIKQVGQQVIIDARKAREEDVAAAKREAEQLVAEAEQELAEARAAALEDAKANLVSVKKELAAAEKQLAEAMVETTKAEAALKSSTKDDSKVLEAAVRNTKSDETEARKAVTTAKEKVDAATRALAKVQIAAE